MSGRSPPWCPGYQEDWAAAAAARSIARLSTCAGQSRQEEEGTSIRGSYSPRASPRDATIIAHASHSPCSWCHHPRQSFSLCDTAAKRRECPHPGCQESWGTSNGSRWSTLKVIPALLRATTFLEKMPPLQQRNLLIVLFECFPFHCFIIV